MPSLMKRLWHALVADEAIIIEDKVPMLESIGTNPPVAIVSARYLNVQEDNSSLRDIMSHLEAFETPEIVVIDILHNSLLWNSIWPRSPNLYALWVAPVSMNVDVTLSQQMSRIQQSLIRKQQSVVALYTSGQLVRLACFQKVHSGIHAAYDLLPIGEAERACVQHYARKREYSHPLLSWQRSSHSRWFVRLVSLVLVLIPAIVVIMVLTRTGTASPATPWVAYPTSNTEGPQYQLKLTGINVSDWVDQNDPSGWHLRLDDQQMIPINLLDKRELAVQAWFKENFPFLQDNHDSGRYLQPEFLSRHQDYPIAQRFHIAHCVTAMRRFLIAMETGRHVCPRDVSLDHLKHCMLQLEEFTFLPKGSQYQDPQNTLRWGTYVCF